MVDSPARDSLMGEQALSGARPSECGSRSGPRWYVLQTHRGAEPLAVEELSNQNFATLLPLRRIGPDEPAPHQPRKHRRRAHFARFAAAFPGYLFVLFDMDRQPWRAIHSTRGIKRLFSYADERPIPVPVGVVEGMMARMSRNMLPTLTIREDDPLDDGVIVTVTSMGGQPALVVRGALKAGCVRVQMLATGWPAEVPRSMVAVSD